MTQVTHLHKNIEGPINTTAPWQDDVLDRLKVAIKLTDAISTITQPFVLSIEAPFGSGKSFFLKRWHQQLKNDGYNTIYFNAWETDYANDPLMAFFSELEDNFLKGTNKKVKEAKAAGKALLKSIALNALETATGGIIKQESFDDAQEAVEDLQSTRMALFKETKENIDEFKKSLNEYGKELRAKDGNNKPVVIFIDELDRCRPTYAIELLENIKHLFNIPNYVFILGIDRKQLLSSASAIYGNNLEGEGYIRKFIDFNYVLPEPKLSNYVKYLHQRFSLADVLPNTDNVLRSGPDLIRQFSALSELFNLSLREQEQLFTKLNFAIRILFGENQVLINPLLCLLLILKEKAPDIYRKYCTEARQANVLIDYFSNLKNGMEFLFNRKKGRTIYMVIILGAADNKSYIEELWGPVVEDLKNENSASKQKNEYLDEIYSWAIDTNQTLYRNYDLESHVANYIYRRLEDDK